MAIKSKKPQLKNKTYYDYNQCRNYLQTKFCYNERDYEGHFKRSKRGTVIGVDEEKPYRDFWHWVLEHHTVHNGCFITFATEQLDDIKDDWIRTIYKNYLDEFANDKGEIELFVWW